MLAEKPLALACLSNVHQWCPVTTNPAVEQGRKRSDRDMARVTERPSWTATQSDQNKTRLDSSLEPRKYRE